MANKLYEESNIQAIADAIRVQNGTQETYTVAEMSDAIMAIQGGLSDDVKEALLNCFAHVAWIDENGQEYYDALYNALYPPVTLDYISAVYTQSGTIYDDDNIDELKNDLVVTAHYSDLTSETVTTYTLSGTLTVGISAITVTYEGKTTTFNVVVTERATLTSISAVYTQSGNVYDSDSLESLKSDLIVTAHYSDSSSDTVSSSDYTLSGTLMIGTSTITVTYEEKTTTFSVIVTEKPVVYRHIWDFTQSLVDSVGGVEAQISTKASQDSSGLHLNNTQSVCLLGTNVFPPNSVVEVTFVSTTAGTFTAQHGRLLMISDIASPVLSTNAGNGFIYRSTGRWAVYKGSWMDSETTDADVFNGKKLTMKYYYSSADAKYHTDVYADDTLIIAYSNSTKWNTNADANNLYIGSVGQAYYSAVISDVKIYDYEG